MGGGAAKLGRSFAPCVKFKATHDVNGGDRWRCAIRKFSRAPGRGMGCGKGRGTEFSVQHTRHNAALVYESSRRAVVLRNKIPRDLKPNLDTQKQESRHGLDGDGGCGAYIIFIISFQEHDAF